MSDDEIPERIRRASSNVNRLEHRSKIVQFAQESLDVRVVFSLIRQQRLGGGDVLILELGQFLDVRIIAVRRHIRRVDQTIRHLGLTLRRHAHRGHYTHRQRRIILHQQIAHAGDALGASDARPAEPTRTSALSVSLRPSIASHVHPLDTSRPVIILPSTITTVRRATPARARASSVALALRFSPSSSSPIVPRARSSAAAWARATRPNPRRRPSRRRRTGKERAPRRTSPRPRTRPRGERRPRGRKARRSPRNPPRRHHSHAQAAGPRAPALRYR